MSNSGDADIVVVGDFNSDMRTLSSSAKMRNLISSYNFHQVIDEPTQYTKHSSSVIDIVLVSEPENVMYSDVTSPFFSESCSVSLPNSVVFKVSKTCE